MKTNEKMNTAKSENLSNREKTCNSFEKAKIEIISLVSEDIITVSFGTNSEDEDAY